MRVFSDQFVVATSGKGTYEITNKLESLLGESRIGDGVLTVFVQHTSCSLVVMENADPTARRDLEEFFNDLVPENADYFEHDTEGADDMPSHIRMVLTRTSETIPVVNGMTDKTHPCQALADLMTIRERLGRLSGVRLAYVGAANSVCRSLMRGAAKFGMRFIAATPRLCERCWVILFV